MRNIVIYPNNDMGSDIITNSLDDNSDRIKAAFFKSVPFESFLALLKNAEFIMGNSSAGIREACIYGIPCINIGSRQNLRFNTKILKNIISVREDKNEILSAIDRIDSYRFVSYYYGHGNSTTLFYEAMLREAAISEASGDSIQKTFVDSNETKERIEQFINEGCE